MNNCNFVYVVFFKNVFVKFEVWGLFFGRFGNLMNLKLYLKIKI